MKTKAILTMVIVLFLISSLNIIPARAQNGGPYVNATIGRYWNYDEEDIFVDSVSGDVTGYLRSRYDISPEGEVDVLGAIIEVETPFGPGNFRDNSSNPDAGYTQDYDEGSGNYTYTWDFGDLLDGQGAMVSLPTNFQATFDMGFEANRSWNPVITSKFVTQTLTIVFNASTTFSDFHNVHVSVQIPNTPEASPSIDPDSISASPMIDERGLNWNMWSQTDGDIEVNWGGDPVPGTPYTFSVDVTVENNLFPEPIFYKPAAGFGANFDSDWFPPDTPPMIDDDINRASGDESAVTYYGLGAFTWQEYAQSEHAITLPWGSFEFSEVFNKIYSMAEGRAIVKQENEFFRGPAHLRINKVPDTVRLSDPDHQTIFWWGITDYRSRGTAIILECTPILAPEGSGGGNAGPVPITVTISRFEEGRGVSASGSGVRFAGRITGIEWPSL